MSIKAKKEYLIAVRERYKKSSKKQKGLILDEFCQVCEYSRSYAIRILRGRITPRRLKPGRKPIYGPEVKKHLVNLWESCGRVCSKKLKAAIPLWLPFYKPSIELSEASKKLLLQVSAASIDRFLKLERLEKKKGMSTTKGNMWIKNNIPIKKLDAKILKPGHMEADTVSHCGDSASGEFISSLTLTDVYSNWTENRAVWTKQSENILPALKEIDRALPFDMCAYTADNGHEVLNKAIRNYLVNERRGQKVFPKRGRPYKKNDNCYVEQKNWTHVRSLFGYARLDDPILVLIMNEIYRAYWNPLQNYFMPMTKLKEKRRIGAKIKKTYLEPKTPCQRLLESDDVCQADKKRLIDKRKCINPFDLKLRMDEKLKEFGKLVEISEVNRNVLKKIAS